MVMMMLRAVSMMTRYDRLKYMTSTLVCRRCFSAYTS
jgi:hypothetical protein